MMVGPSQDDPFIQRARWNARIPPTSAGTKRPDAPTPIQISQFGKGTLGVVSRSRAAPRRASTAATPVPDLWLAARHEPLPSWLAALSSHADLSGVVVPGPGIHALAAPDYRASVCDNLAPSHPAARMAQLRPPTSAGIVLAANAGIRPGAAPGVPVSVRVVGVAGVAGERRVRTAIGRTNPRPEIDDLRAPPSARAEL
ncbi:hypothetical protein T484DRAFT_1880138 [Baffinella frigidus]|nr:hypothetical protein T484DRAFT_1880138 [Cryptophyta sp. CCMP2293]